MRNRKWREGPGMEDKREHLMPANFQGCPHPVLKSISQPGFVSYQVYLGPHFRR